MLFFYLLYFSHVLPHILPKDLDVDSRNKDSGGPGTTRCLLRSPAGVSSVTRFKWPQAARTGTLWWNNMEQPAWISNIGNKMVVQATKTMIINYYIIWKCPWRICASIWITITVAMMTMIDEETDGNHEANSGNDEEEERNKDQYCKMWQGWLWHTVTMMVIKIREEADQSW